MFHSSNACGNSANITTIQTKHGMGSEVTFNPYYKYLQIVFHQYFEIVYVSNEISLQKVWTWGAKQERHQRRKCCFFLGNVGHA